MTIKSESLSRRTRRTASRALFCILGAAFTTSVLAHPSSAAISAGSYTFTEQFRVPSTANQQGLAYANGLFYVGFDVGNNNGKIVAYNSTGTLVKESPVLPVGHSAEISYRRADGNFYVATGGAGSTKVNVVDMRPTVPAIVRTYDFTALGINGMVAVDNTKDNLVVFSGPNGGPFVITTTDMAGTVKQRFTIASQGVPQGIEVAGNDILVYSSYTGGNRITSFSQTGAIVSQIPAPFSSEGQGLAVDSLTNRLYVGSNSPNRVYSMSPNYVPSSTAPSANLIVNGGAEASPGGSGHGNVVALPGWVSTGGMTAIRYGANAGYPSATGPGSSSRGTSFFSGGQVVTSTMSQSVGVTPFAAAIDSGAATANLAGWLGGFQNQNDNLKVTATFLNSSNASLGSTSIGPVTAAERSNVTGMVLRSKSTSVPAGTRSISIVVTATRVGGLNNDGYADDLSLTIS